ncbi:MAG: tRNA (adenosine(37)-N6)-threonylcarbamoyltransferase complex ATPase subunit type 1 TsaE [Chitinophagales bacterium]
MTKAWEINSPDELNAVAKALLSAASPNKRFAVYGEMGAGKTTFIKECCNILGVDENTSSPTFAIVNEYIGTEKIYHFDLFRINNIDELKNIGFDEYLDDEAYIFIEWPQLVEPMIMHHKFSSVHIHVNGDKKRIITLGS